MKSDLPFGSEFSPSQIRLPHLLELAHTLGGDWKAFEEAVRAAYFAGNATSDYNKGKLANNAKLGMIAYGLIDRDANLTELGRKLHELRNDEVVLHAEFARHILLNLNGMNLVQCIQDIQAAGEVVDLIKLREWLAERGLHFPRGGKHPSMMRLWLEKAGVFTGGWRVDEARLRAILGASTADIETLAALNREQRVYLKTLANMGGDGPYFSNEVEKLASATYGIKFNEKNLPKQVLYPLEQAGYITLSRRTKEDGRGAKPFLVMATAQLIADLVNPILEQIERQTDSELRPLLRRPLGDILMELKSTDRHIRGLALEALAFKLMRLLDLNYVATRLRGAATGGAEVDLIFESVRLVFSRWQIQCKNTDRVSLDDVAKEVGLTHVLKSNVIVMVTTGEVGPEARRYAEIVRDLKPVQIIFLDYNDLNLIITHPSLILRKIVDQACLALCLKENFSLTIRKVF